MASKKVKIDIPNNQPTLQKIANWFHDYQQAKGPNQIALLLSHQYSESSLNWENLKGKDQAWAEILRLGSMQEDFRIGLAQLTLQLSYTVEESFGYDDDDDELDLEEIVDDPESLVDFSFKAEQLLDINGSQLAISFIPVERSEITSEDRLQNVEPKNILSGLNGNEGLIRDRLDRHAVLFIWPEHTYHHVLCGLDSRAAIGEVQRLFQVWQTSGKVADKVEVERLVNAILTNWPSLSDWDWQAMLVFPDSQGPLHEVRPEMILDFILALDNVELLQLYIQHVMLQDHDLQPVPRFDKTVFTFGWPNVQNSITYLLENGDEAAIHRNLQLLVNLNTRATQLSEQEISSEPSAPQSEQQTSQGSKTIHLDWKRQVRTWLDILLEKLVEFDNLETARLFYRLNWTREKLLFDLLLFLGTLQAEDLVVWLRAHCESHLSHYPLLELQVPMWQKMAARPQTVPVLELAATQNGLAANAAELEEMVASSPVTTPNWEREAVTGCDCADCQELKRFMKDPQERVHQFQMNLKRRRHLEAQVTANRLDLTLKTDTQPRPQILICIKKSTNYDKEMRQRQKILFQLQELQMLLQQYSN